MIKKIFIAILALFLMYVGIHCTNQSGTNHKTSHATDAQLAEERPGWEQDLKVFQYKESKEAPENLSLYYYRLFHHQKSVAFRLPSNLTNQQEMGPSNISGRSRAYLIDRQDPDHHLAGSVSGGLWESWDAGGHWVPQSDHEENMSVTYLSQNPFNPDIIYYCTGEVAGNSTRLNGVGVFKSEDGGRSFELLPGSQQNGLFSSWRVECSKTDSNTLYVATPKGIYVSRDAGETFRLEVVGDCTDIEILEDSTVYYAIKSRGIYRGNEGNLTQATLLDLPVYDGKVIRRIEMAYCRAHSEVLYAAFEDGNSTKLLGIARSDDGGVTWKKVGYPGIANNYAWYTHTLQVHPTHPDIVIYGNIQMAASYNGGQTWNKLTSSHADKHLFYFDPHDPDHMIATHDGGIDDYYYWSGKLQFSESLSRGFNVTQYYAGDIFPDENRVIGGAQDNGTTTGTDENLVFEKKFGADGGFCAVAQDNPDKVVVSTQQGNLFGTRHFKRTQIPWKYLTLQVQEGSYFINPFYMNQQSTDELLFVKRGGVWFTPDFGEEWYAVDSLLNGMYAGIIMQRNNKRYVFVGGLNTRLYRFDDVSPKDTTLIGIRLNTRAPRSLRNAFIRTMELDPVDSNALIVGFSSVSDKGRVWRVEGVFSDDPEWVNISGDLPKYLPVNTVAISNSNPDQIAVGTSYGVFTTIDGGVHWQRDTVIPNVAVFQVKIRRRDNKLFVFTHGRGAWMADFPPVVATQSVDKVDLNITLFPNPVRDVIHFRTSDRLNFALKLNKYEIVDINGVTVQTGVLTDIRQRINVSGLSMGTYILVLRPENGGPTAFHFIKR